MVFCVYDCAFLEPIRLFISDMSFRSMRRYLSISKKIKIRIFRGYCYG